MTKPLIGIHHVTAITSSAEKISQFYTAILGLRLVKKNINQDDLGTYHLYFGDDRGHPGTAMTFFDFKGIAQHRPGTNDIARTGFRVASDEALTYWLKRFEHYDVKHQAIQTLFNRKVLFFEDFDHQQYALFSDQDLTGVEPGEAWHNGPVPDDYAILGLGAVFLTVANLDYTDNVLTEILSFKRIDQQDNLVLYETGPGGNGAALVIEEKPGIMAHQGYGGVHHLAFRVKDRDHLASWQQKLDTLHLPHSGFVDRFYFGSVYVRLLPNILFEFATDGPGFIDDQESYETLGETLTLPPHLRQYESEIKRHLRHFETTTHFTKEPLV